MSSTLTAGPLGLCLAALMRGGRLDPHAAELILTCADPALAERQQLEALDTFITRERLLPGPDALLWAGAR